MAKTIDNTPIGSINRNEYYVWDGDDVVLDFVDADGGASPSATIAKRYLWGQAIDQILAEERRRRSSGRIDGNRELGAHREHEGQVRSASYAAFRS